MSVMTKWLQHFRVDYSQKMYSIIICSKRDECDAFNKECLERLSGNYVANDTDNKRGHPLL